MRRRWIKRLACILVWPIAAAAAQSDDMPDTGLTVSVDRRELGIAERLRLTLRITAPATALIAFPDVGADLADFSVINQRQTTTTTTATQVWRREYLLAPRGPGTARIPGLTAIVQLAADGAGPRQRRLHANAMTIDVIALVPDDTPTTALKDIAPPIALARPAGYTPLWPVILVAAALGAIVLVIWRRRRQHRDMRQPAHALALAALRGLDPDDQAHVAAFYGRLSGILRRYVFWRFGLRAPMRTTEEILAAMARLGDPAAGQSDRFGALLRDVDRVKFARHRPGAGDMARALADVTAIIEATADANVTVMPAARAERP